MRRLAATLVLALGLVATAAFAGETITHGAAQVSVGVPATWKTKTAGDTLTLMDKQEDVAVAFSVTPAADLKDSAKRLEQNIDKRVKNLKWVKEERVNVNGMKGVELVGDGDMDGKNIDLAILVLDTPSDKFDLFVIAIAEDAVLAKHKPEINWVFRNLKPAKH